MKFASHVVKCWLAISSVVARGCPGCDEAAVKDIENIVVLVAWRGLSDGRDYFRVKEKESPRMQMVASLEPKWHRT